ncbi:MAG: MarR family winged helix-turn-helix transcriptional regulator [Gaiellaceae bacterium]
MVKTPAQQDHIDRFLEQVQKLLPSLDLSVEGIVDRVMGIQRRLRRMLDETLEEHGLSYGEWNVLGALRRAEGERRPAGELAGIAELSSAAMTNRLDRLEEAGLVRRVRDADDRRSVQVELTAAGKRLYEKSVETQAAKESIVAAALSTREQTQLNDLLRKLMLEFERREPHKKTKD